MARGAEKRNIDTVDLTAEDGLQQPHGQPHKVSRRDASGEQYSDVDTGAILPSQSQRSTQPDVDDDNGAEELVDGSQTVDDAYTSYELYGEQIHAQTLVAIFVSAGMDN